jgi:hypothetical protein
VQALSGILSNLFVTVVLVGAISAALANVVNNQVACPVLSVLTAATPFRCRGHLIPVVTKSRLLIMPSAAS